MGTTKWTHPIHAKGVRSPRLDVRGGKLLTDKKIHHYAKAGFYGTEVQAAALENQKEKKKRKRPLSSLQAAMALLRSLTS